MAARPYFTLFTREPDGKWYPQFGDYKRDVVQREREDSYNHYKRKDTQIVDTGVRQSAVDAAQHKLNNPS